MSCSLASRVVGTRSREILSSGFETFVYDFVVIRAWDFVQVFIGPTLVCQAGKAMIEPSEGWCNMYQSSVKNKNQRSEMREPSCEMTLSISSFGLLRAPWAFRALWIHLNLRRTVWPRRLHRLLSSYQQTPSTLLQSQHL